jgi:hypothetical protein
LFFSLFLTIYVSVCVEFSNSLMCLSYSAIHAFYHVFYYGWYIFSSKIFIVLIASISVLSFSFRIWNLFFFLCFLAVHQVVLKQLFSNWGFTHPDYYEVSLCHIILTIRWSWFAESLWCLMCDIILALKD